MTKQMACGSAMLLLMAVGPLPADEPDTVRMRGQEFTIWPAEDLRARGFDVSQVPRSENAAWVYIDAVNAYVELPPGLADTFDYAHRTAWPAGQAKLEEYLEEPGNRQALDKVHQASRMERCQLPYFGDSSQSVIAVLLPSLSGFRWLSKIQVADGRYLETQERYADAADKYFTAMRMGEHVGQGITLIEGLVGLAVWSLADRALADMVLRRPLSAAQLEKLHTELNQRAPRIPTTMRGLQGERTFGPGIIDELCSRLGRLPGNTVEMFGAPGDDWFGSFEGTSNPYDGWGKLELRIGQLIFPDRAIKSHMLDYYDLVLARAERGPRRGAELEFDEEEYISEKIPRWDVFSRTLLPSLSRATVLGERIKADLAALRTMVAIRLHMLKHDGQPPENLHELKARLPEGAMMDPFGDGLLRYRRTADGWLLYSVGPDLVDDGGERGKLWDKLDLVYQFPPPPIEPFEAPESEE